MDKGHPKESLEGTGKFEPELSSARVQGYLAEASASSEEGQSDETLEAIAYVARVQREIESEVAALRAEGKYPPSLVARIKRYYQTLLPPGSATALRDFDEAYRLLDRVAYIDIDVPTQSQKPGVSQIKRVARIFIAWYLNYVAQQFNNFSSNLIRLIGIIDARIARLEAKFDETDFSAVDLIGVTASLSAQRELAAALAAELGDSKGRILVAECGDGAILALLADQGRDVYGIDTRVEYLDQLEIRRLEVRNAKTLSHLAKVENSSLGTLVLSGIVDRASISDRVAALFHAKRVLYQGGTLAIVSSGLETFMAPENHLEADLSPGRPFTPQTWAELARRLSFSHVRTLFDAKSNHFVVIANNTKIETHLSWLSESAIISAARDPRLEK